MLGLNLNILIPVLGSLLSASLQGRFLKTNKQTCYPLVAAPSGGKGNNELVCTFVF